MMTAVALLLSLSGIYAVLSFIVARRRREIGVRVALGASRGHVVAAIFRRPLSQVGLGVLAGGALIAAAATASTWRSRARRAGSVRRPRPRRRPDTMAPSAAGQRRRG